MKRRRTAALVLGGILMLGASPSQNASPSPSASPGDVPSEPLTLVRASVDPSGPAGLATAAAFADSLDTGIRLVRVRIVDTLDLQITLRSEAGVVLAEPPVLCLHWIDAAPDDAGLESPCWGIPDPSTELAASMVRDDGSWVLDRAQTVAVHARLTRGGRRCDYPPGAWILRVRVVPLVDGVVQPPMYTEAPFEVAYERTDVPTRLPLSETRFCGLASEVIREQGAPPTPAP